MSTPTAVADGRVRVTVAAGYRRVDLALPGSVPVVELLPALARAVGRLDPGTAHAGLRLVTADGDPLSGERGLAGQGVVDGSLLTVTIGSNDERPRVYDDVVEAMADAVAQELPPWSATDGRRAAVAAGAVLLGAGAGGWLFDAGRVAGMAAATAALVLLCMGVLAARSVRASSVGAGALLLAACHAAAAGLVLAPGGPRRSWALEPAVVATPLACAGAAVLAVGLVGMLLLRDHRAAALPPVVVGSAALLSWVAITSTSLAPGAVLCAVLTLVVLSGSVLPWLALATTRVGGEHLAPVRATVTVAAVDAEALRRDVVLGHRVLLALVASVGVVLVLLAPFAVATGPAGAALAVMCCLAVMSRARQLYAAREVAAALVSGGLGLVSSVASMLLIHEGWRTPLLVGVVVVGVVALASGIAGPASPRRRRWAEVLDAAAVVSLLPLLVAASGLPIAVVG